MTKKDLLKVILAVTLTISAYTSVGVLSFWYDRFETPEQHYENYDTAVANGAVERGWLPRSLPLSARNISSHGDLDLGFSFGSFEFSREEWPELRAKLEPMSQELDFRVDTSGVCAPEDGGQWKLASSLKEKGYFLFRESRSPGYLIAARLDRGCVLFFNGKQLASAN